MLEKIPASLGRALGGMRAGVEKLILGDTALAHVPTDIEITSPAFADDAPLPERFTADGPGMSPPLTWRGAPPQTAELVLLVEDPDASAPHPLVHAIVWKLRGTQGAIAEGALSSSSAHASASAKGRNSYLSREYLPPDPPPGHGLHRYVFELFALDAPAQFESAPGRGELLDLLKAHAIAKGGLVGTYERH